MVAGLGSWIGLPYVLPRSLPGWAGRTTRADFVFYAIFLVPTVIVVARSFRHNRPFLFAAVRVGKP